MLIAGVAVAANAGMLFMNPIPQDPAYHAFADRRAWFSVPNFWNVATNLPFLAVGVLGLARLRRLAAAALRMHYIVFCVGVTLVASGSTYYHYAPSTPTLVWDRLPMTIAFMALFAAVFGDRISERAGHRLLWPLIALGIFSIAWWGFSEMDGRGDLRLYALVQFLPMLLIPLMLVLLPGRALHAAWLWASLGAYIAAKVAEHFDGAILAATGGFSGHSLKHLLAALGAWCAIRAFQAVPG
ncbi:MAG TPA: ceramidase domain-containing protein, partial [Erythrobacter sp.]|nr:ceramidase domain-containing protein [Erythrobacter sp.]